MTDPLRDQLDAPKSYPPKCPDCDGGESGMHRDGTPILCDTCEGSGFVDEQGAPTTVLDWREAKARAELVESLGLNGSQPWREDFANALTICDAWASPELSDNETGVAFQSVARLIRHALAQLEGSPLRAPQEDR